MYSWTSIVFRCMSVRTAATPLQSQRSTTCTSRRTTRTAPLCSSSTTSGTSSSTTPTLPACCCRSTHKSRTQGKNLPGVKIIREWDENCCWPWTRVCMERPTLIYYLCKYYLPLRQRRVDPSLYIKKSQPLHLATKQQITKLGMFTYGIWRSRMSSENPANC